MGISKHKKSSLDPLYIVFEQHLFNFHDPEVDRHTFLNNVVTDYLKHLRGLNVTVPRSLEQPIREELIAQVNTILIKKIYGCLSIEDYQNRLTIGAKRNAKTRYKGMVKAPKN